MEQSLNPESSQSLSHQFTELVASVLQLYDYAVTTEEKQINGSPRGSYTPDLKLEKGGVVALVELKFYRNRRIPSGPLMDAAARLVSYSKRQHAVLVLIVSGEVLSATKLTMLNQHGIILWDRADLAGFIENKGDEALLENFRRLLMSAQQGTDVVDPFDDLDIGSMGPDTILTFMAPPQAEKLVVPEKGQRMIQELSVIPLGKEGWGAFEKKAGEILKYLFERDLTVWEEQQVTDDDLARFDLVCRILPEDDFWRSLILAFNSRYILFEFKNYTDPITQAQIYTTERYLYPRALRSVGIIISRKGATDHAQAAAKGALREQGKLIMLLDDEDLVKMLIKRDAGGSASDYLSDKLDEFLLSLSR